MLSNQSNTHSNGWVQTCFPPIDSNIFSSWTRSCWMLLRIMQGCKNKQTNKKDYYNNADPRRALFTLHVKHLQPMTSLHDGPCNENIVFRWSHWKNIKQINSKIGLAPLTHHPYWDARLCQTIDGQSARWEGQFPPNLSDVIDSEPRNYFNRWVDHLTIIIPSFMDNASNSSEVSHFLFTACLLEHTKHRNYDTQPSAVRSEHRSVNS